jgi:hypothetical protein
MDQKTLIKNRFWIVLGTAASLTLINWLILLITVPSTVSGKQSELQKKWEGDVKSVVQYKHVTVVEAARKEAEELDAEGKNLHKILYESQSEAATLMTWPKTMMDAFDLKGGKYALKMEIKPPKTDPKSLPPDEDGTKFYGTFSGDVEEDWLTVKGRDGKVVKFFVTSNFPKNLTEEGGKGNLEFGSLGQFSGGNSRLVAVTYVAGKYFGEELTPNEIRKFKNTYKEQLNDVLAEIGPLNAMQQPVVLFRYGGNQGSRFTGAPKGVPGGRQGFNQPPGLAEQPTEAAEVSGDSWVYRKDRLPPVDNRFFSYVPEWDDRVLGISDEIWAAQENLWLTREFYRRIKAINEAVARLDHISTDQTSRWSKFRNFYWELELKPSGNGLLAKLKNLRPYRQAIDSLRFLVKFKEDGPEVMFPPEKEAFLSDALEPDKTFTTPEPIEVPGVALNGISSVKQILTTETAAVKRIDLLLIGSDGRGDIALSHRQAYRSLQPFKKKAEAKDDSAGVAGVAAAKGRGPAGGVDSAISTHGVVLDRYLEVGKESRKIPVSLVLIVDPDHLALVQAALIDSQLRYLVTQVLWTRCQLTIGSSAGEPKVATVPTGPRDGKGGPPGFGGRGAPPGYGGRGAPPGFGGPEGPGAARGEAGSGATDSQENLELTVFGVVTIYERPGRPDDAAAPPAAPPPAQPK